MVQANLEKQLVDGKAVFDEPQAPPPEVLPEPDVWDWVFPDGSRVQVDADLLRAMVGIPTGLLGELGPGYLEFAKNRVAEHLERTKSILKDDSLRAYTFQRAGGTSGGICYYHYKCDAPPALPPPPPPPPEPLAVAVVPDELEAKNKDKHKNPQEEITLEEIADVITQLTMQECDELATLLHERGIKAVFATFGSNNNLPASAIIRQSVPRAQAPALPSASSMPARGSQQVPMRKAPPPEPAPPAKKVEDKRPTLPVMPRELPDTGDDEELMWRSVYKRPIASLDILEDL